MKNVLALLAVAGAASVATAQISIVPSNVSFVDISTTGTAVPGSLSDDSEATVLGTTHNWVGNGLFAGGMAIRVGNNGGIIWGTSAADAFTGCDNVGYYNACPANAAGSILTMSAANGADTGNGFGIRQFVCPFWDDLTPVSSTTTSIRWQVIGNDLIVQWNREDSFSASGAGDVTFEAIFHGGVALNSGASLVDFVYQDTVFNTSRYQNDGGAATIGLRNNGINAGANDVQYGVGGGGPSATSDPAFGDASMAPKVSGWAVGDNPNLPHSLSIIPTPGAAAILGLGGLLAGRRRR